VHIGILTPEYATSNAPSGGLANYVRKVSQALTRRGHRVGVFVSAEHERTWCEGAVSVTEVRRVEFDRLGARGKRYLCPLARLWTAKRLAAQVWRVHRRAPFDLFHVANFTAPGYALLKNRRVPVVCRASSYTPLWRSAYGSQRGFPEYLCDWIELKQVTDADATFAPSRLIADTLARFEGIHPTVIRSPEEAELPEVDRSFFEQNRPTLPYLLFFGQLSRIKGVDVLARSAARVLARHSDMAIVFIGRDDGLPNGSTCQEYILAQCERFTERVHIFKPLAKNRLFAFVEEALGVVLPSRVDNFPNACLESQQVGTVVIGTHGSSLDEMIVDGQTGFLAANGDDVDLERAIERLLAMDSCQRATMKQALSQEVARRKAEDHVGQLIEFYSSVVDSFRADPGRSRHGPPT